jgi:hypothetical protein
MFNFLARRLWRAFAVCGSLSLAAPVCAEMVDDGAMTPENPLPTALQGCRSNAIGKGFLSPQWLRSKPRPSGRGLNLRTALKGGVSNRS